MKKLIALILCLVLLTGCSLAVPGKAGLDELVGVFVTVSREENGEKMEFWDEEAAGIGFISNYTLEGQKFWASRVEGDPDSYAFAEGCGISCFVYDVYDENGESFRSNTCSPEMDVRKMVYYAGDPSRYELEAVIYATADAKLWIQANPVYQTPDGDVYVLSDKPISYMVEGGAGFSSFHTQDAEVERDYTTYAGNMVKLTVEYVVLPEIYVVIEMDGDNQVLRQREFTPGEAPETYVPGEGTAYLILEARAGEDTTRTVYSPGDEDGNMDTYRIGEYGLCIKGYTAIEWEGAK